MGTGPSWGTGRSPGGNQISQPTETGGLLQPTFARAARIWWAWVWRSVVFGGAAGLFGSVVLSLSGVLEHISDKAGQVLGAAIGIALAVPVGIWVFQMILEKDFGEFRIRLVRRLPPSSSPLPMDESS
jgi:hypothetical protein